MAENGSSSSGSGSCLGCMGGGISIAGVIAFVLSYSTFHSIGWALLAAIFGYGYIIYWMVYHWK